MTIHTKHQTIAAAKGWVIVDSFNEQGPKGHNYKKYRMVHKSCGHELVIHSSNINNPVINCPSCQREALTDKYSKAAEQRGYDYVSHDDRNATLRCKCCGTEKTTHISNLLNLNVAECCNARNNISYLYLAEIRISDDIRFLKLGSSRLPEYRYANLGLPKSARVIELGRAAFMDREAAFAREAEMKEQFRHRTIHREYTSEYMSNGVRECYPVEMAKEILKAM